MIQRLVTRVAHWGPAEWGCLCLTLLAIPWMTWHLGYLPLWEDEAHTALIARNILAFGRPIVWDGVNLISGVNGEDFGPNLLLTWDGPLQFYLVALSFWLFGESEWSARLPFVLMGLAALPFTFLLARHMTRNGMVGLLAVFMMLTSAPFLLHIRNARYYGALLFLALVAIYGTVLLGTRRRGLLYFVLGGIGLFYTHWVSAILILTGLAAYGLCSGAHARRPLCIGLGGIALAAAPWLSTGIDASASYASSPIGLKLWFGRLALSIYRFNRFVFPIALLPAGIWLWRAYPMQRRWLALCLGWIAMGIPLMAFHQSPPIRYLIWLIPVATIILAQLIVLAHHRHRALGVTAFLLIAATLVPMKLPGLSIHVATALLQDDYRYYVDNHEHLPPNMRYLRHCGLLQRANDQIFRAGHAGQWLMKYDLAAYWRELTTPYRDPIRGVTAFLAEHAQKGDEVLLSVDAFALAFYLPHLRQAWIAQPNTKTRDKLKQFPSHVRSFEDIRWYIPRRKQRLKGPILTEGAFLFWAYRTGRRFQRHVLDYDAFKWDGSRAEKIEFYVRKRGLLRSLSPNNPVVVYEILPPHTAPQSVSQAGS